MHSRDRQEATTTRPKRAGEPGTERAPTAFILPQAQRAATNSWGPLGIEGVQRSWSLPCQLQSPKHGPQLGTLPHLATLWPGHSHRWDRHGGSQASTSKARQGLGKAATARHLGDQEALGCTSFKARPWGPAGNRQTEANTPIDHQRNKEDKLPAEVEEGFYRGSPVPRIPLTAHSQSSVASALPGQEEAPAQYQWAPIGSPAASKFPQGPSRNPGGRAKGTLIISFTDLRVLPGQPREQAVLTFPH